MDKYSVNPTFNFTEEDLVDIISSAIYSIGYWACINNDTDDWNRVSASLPEDRSFEDVMFTLMKTGYSVDIEDAEGYDGLWHLTLSKLLKGIQLTIENKYWNGDMDEIDGVVGDIIFQYALFDEIIYG